MGLICIVDFAGLTPIGKTMLIVLSITGVAQWIMNICNNYITYHVVQDIRKDAMDRIQIVPLKYLDGHATCVGGVLVDGGNFNWDNGKYPELTTPELDYHGLVYTEAFGNAAVIAKARAGLLRDIGATMSPFNAFLINLGCETLAVRMQRHSENALAVAKYLSQHEKVEWVSYPGLESDPNYELAQKYQP